MKTVSNNKFHDCPPRMDDGRHFTDYRPHNLVYKTMSEKSQNLNSFEMRQFMINNATNIQEEERRFQQVKNGCDLPMKLLVERTSTPQTYERICNQNVCQTRLAKVQPGSAQWPKGVPEVDGALYRASVLFPSSTSSN